MANGKPRHSRALRSFKASIWPSSTPIAGSSNSPRPKPTCGPHKTIYNRFIRWSRLGVFNRILAELAAEGGETDNLMVDATHLKAHRTAASLLKKGLYPDVLDAAEAD